MYLFGRFIALSSSDVDNGDGHQSGNESDDVAAIVLDINEDEDDDLAVMDVATDTAEAVDDGAATAADIAIL
jgi:hypothetical protein